MKREFLVTVRMLFVIYVAAVCCLCFLNLSFSQNFALPTYIWDIRSDRVVHFLMFLPFPILAIPVFNFSGRSTGLKFWKCAVIFFSGIVFAASTELIQKYLIVAREGDIIDFAADVLGLVTGLILFFICCPPIIIKSHSNELF